MDGETSIKRKFDIFANEMRNQGATYAALLLMDSRGSIIFNDSTNVKWDEIYRFGDYFQDCHLTKIGKKLASKVGSHTVVWDTILPDCEISNYLNRLRLEHQVAHGVSFCNVNRKGILEAISIAGPSTQTNFALSVINNKKKIIEAILNHKKTSLKDYSLFI